MTVVYLTGRGNGIAIIAEMVTKKPQTTHILVNKRQNHATREGMSVGN